MEDELKQKIEKLEALYDAVERARRHFMANPTYATSAALQNLKRQAAAVRRTLPKPKLAYDASDL